MAAFSGEVRVEVGGKVWTLVFDFNAMADFEQKTGKSSFQALEQLESDALPVADVRTLVQCMLLDHHPDATERQAGKIMSADPEALARALALAMPEADPAAGKPTAPGLTLAPRG